MIAAIVVLGVVVAWMAMYGNIQLDKLKKKAEGLDAKIFGVKDMVQGDYAIISRLRGEVSVLQNKIQCPPKPRTPNEDTLRALGGRVDKCYRETGELRSVSASAPWMSEPIIELVYGPKDGGINWSEHVAGEAIELLVKMIHKPTGKKK